MTSDVTAAWLSAEPLRVRGGYQTRWLHPMGGGSWTMRRLW